ncbi:MAG: CHAD domain-containing protein, partial [Phycisphaerales bacterium]|nr:CHAD domain-containing protein [Phycisphaerales bacterium]
MTKRTAPRGVRQDAELDARRAAAGPAKGAAARITPAQAQRQADQSRASRSRTRAAAVASHGRERANPRRASREAGDCSPDVHEPESRTSEARSGVHAARGTLDRARSCRVSCRALVEAEFAGVREALLAAGQPMAPDADRATAIHAYRRGLKRIQAARTLLQDAFPRSSAAAAVALRDAKSALAGSRAQDALALLLEEICGAPAPRTAAVGIPHVEHDAPDALVRAASAVERAWQAMRVRAGAPIDWVDVAGRASRTWDRARARAMDRWLGRSDEWLHETRKRFQRCADQIAALGNCASGPMGTARRSLRAAAESLGRARDLGILASAIDRSSPEGTALADRADSLRADAIRAARTHARAAL